MTSPARRHFERSIAATAAVGDPTAPVPAAYANGYELMLAQLTEDRRKLKAIQSVERKIALKRDLLPKYQPWVEGRLAGNAGGQDDVLMTVMVWHIDTGDFDRALAIAEYALAHGLTLPDQYKRDVATLVAEEIAEQALAAQADDKPFATEYLLAADALTAGSDMPDEVRAKLQKALGLNLTITDPARALEHLRRAVALHDRVGVKKDIERLERELKKSSDTP